MDKVNPTSEIYEQLQFAYSYFNEKLFDNELPNCVITIQREKNTMGFFSPMRWNNLKGQSAHEISLNPSYFLNRSMMEIFQTLVHEQCHLWQYENGMQSRPGYHNQEWATKMESLGLIPSDTGAEGGNMVGQKMSDYPAKNGFFMKACIELVNANYLIRWIDRQPSKELDEAVAARSCIALTPEEILVTPLAKIIDEFDYQIKPKKQKIKYHCASCGLNVWGKKNLNLRCEDCNEQLMYCASS